MLIWWLEPIPSNKSTDLRPFWYSEKLLMFSTLSKQVASDVLGLAMRWGIWPLCVSSDISSEMPGFSGLMPSSSTLDNLPLEWMCLSVFQHCLSSYWFLSILWTSFLGVCYNAKGEADIFSNTLNGGVSSLPAFLVEEEIKPYLPELQGMLNTLFACCSSPRLSLGEFEALQTSVLWTSISGGRFFSLCYIITAGIESITLLRVISELFSANGYGLLLGVV